MCKCLSFSQKESMCAVICKVLDVPCVGDDKGVFGDYITTLRCWQKFTTSVNFISLYKKWKLQMLNQCCVGEWLQKLIIVWFNVNTWI